MCPMLPPIGLRMLFWNYVFNLKEIEREREREREKSYAFIIMNSALKKQNNSNIFKFDVLWLRMQKFVNEKKEREEKIFKNKNIWEKKRKRKYFENCFRTRQFSWRKI